MIELLNIALFKVFFVPIDIGGPLTWMALDPLLDHPDWANKKTTFGVVRERFVFKFV